MHHLYRQKGSDNWRVRFTLEGTRVNESTGTALLSEAKAYLERKRTEIRDGLHAPHAGQATVSEICLSKLSSDRVNGLDSYSTVEGRWRLHLEPLLGGVRAVHINADVLGGYIAHRQGENASNATINRELALLRSAFSLARKSGVLKVSPWFPMLREDNVRTGFLRDEDYPGLASACSLEGIWMRGIFEIANAYGWRSDSIRSLRVRQVDFEDGSIRLDDTKNGEPVEAKMTSVIRQVMQACCAGKHPDARVFTRSGGRPVLSFRKAWARATAAAGVPGLLFHDLCRTAMRNMRRLGIDESVAMDVSGRRTPSIFRRYNIVDGKDRTDVARRLDEKQAVVIGTVIVPRDGEPMAEAIPVQPALVH